MVVGFVTGVGLVARSYEPENTPILRASVPLQFL